MTTTLLDTTDSAPGVSAQAAAGLSAPPAARVVPAAAVNPGPGLDTLAEPLRAGIIGGSGYTGGELLRLLLDHPNVSVTRVASERLAGRWVHHTHPHLRGRTQLRFCAPDEVGGLDVLFLATPHGMSSRSPLLDAAPLVIDLSADHRLRDPAQYPRWYGWEHPDPARLAQFVYGLGELHREELRGAARIATGGCLATATILGLWPLVRVGVVDLTRPLVVEAKVGSSAAGAQAGPGSHHPHRSGELRSFAPTGHRHTAEIVQELQLPASAEVAFSATAVDAVRGILATAHAWLGEDLDDRALRRIYRDAYGDEPFVRVVREAQGLHRSPNPKLLWGTNLCDVGFERDPHSRRVVVTSAIDNLVKGAAGQAVQALNISRGWDERLGLGFSGLYPV